MFKFIKNLFNHRNSVDKVIEENKDVVVPNTESSVLVEKLRNGTSLEVSDIVFWPLKDPMPFRFRLEDGSITTPSNYINALIDYKIKERQSSE